MSTGQGVQDFEFGPYRLEPGERRLLRNGAPVPLQPKHFDFLYLLVRNSPKLVIYDAFLTEVWSDEEVYLSNLYACASSLNKTLGLHETGEAYIENVSKSGYRFIDVVRPVERAQFPDKQRGSRMIEAPKPIFVTDRQYLEATYPERYELIRNAEHTLKAMIGCSRILSEFLTKLFACLERKSEDGSNYEQLIVLGSAESAHRHEVSYWKPSGWETESEVIVYQLLLSKSFELHIGCGRCLHLDVVGVFESHKTDPYHRYTTSPGNVPHEVWETLAEDLKHLSDPIRAIDALLLSLGIKFSTPISDEALNWWHAL